MVTHAPFPADDSTAWGGHYRTTVGDFDRYVSQVYPAGVAFRTVAASGESADIKAMCDYVCDGTADEVQINQAIADLNPTNVLGYGTVGGTVCLIGRRFNVADGVKLRTQTEVFGSYGMYATRVFSASTYTAGAGNGIFELYDDTTQYVTLHSVATNGASGNCSGIYFALATNTEWDSSLVVRNVHIMKAGQHGVHFANLNSGKCRGNTIQNLTIIDATLSGVYADCPDSDWENIQIGSSGSDGFVVNRPNNRLRGIKSWFSASGSGFLIQNGRGDAQIVGCEAQDNYAHGFEITASRCTLSGCNADSNGYSRSIGTSTGSGFYVSANGVEINGTADDKNENSRQTTSGGQQHYILELANSPKIIANILGTGNVSNTVSGTAGSGSVVNVVGY